VKVKLMKATKPDRRTERSRQALMSAFVQILLEEGFESVSVERVAARANVGRSTFYMHYKSKEDILRQSMTNPSISLAKLVGGNLTVESILPLLEHFKEQRKRNRIFFLWPIRPIWVSRLAELIEPRLATLVRVAGGRPIVPLPLLALQIAEGQIGLVANWLLGQQAVRNEAVAEALLAATRASVAALLRPRTGASLLFPG
jgi:AcrR family transcriptional regulator